MMEISESHPVPANSPTLEKLVPNFDSPYIRLNPGHTTAVLGDPTLADVLKGYVEIEDSPDAFNFMKIPTSDFAKLFQEVPPETMAAFQHVLKQELHAGKMSGLINAYKSRIDRWGEPDITQEEVIKIREEALDALRQQHAVTNLPAGILPFGFKTYTMDELETAAKSIDETDTVAEHKGIVLDTTNSNNED